tara:strand:+ start:495 stop:683 length:189 start_codon:yes stop_codon:yes gene_type:complete
MKQVKEDREPPLYIQVERGYKAFRRGRLSNPYEKSGSALYKEWERGFNKAYFANLEKINAAG